MTTTRVSVPYVLGSTDAEHARLIRQAALFEPFTERLFRDAGIGPGQRVLDIGSGVGDVAMLVGRLVGPSGEVVGVDRDASVLAKAKARVAEAGLQNVRFTESDVGEVAKGIQFDAVVGRLILEFLPDPGTVVRSLSQLIAPGGVLVVQDACWAPLLQLTAHLPLWAACASLIHRSFERSGANMDMEQVLYRTFREAGLPAPSMHLEVPVGDDPAFSRWICDLTCSMRPRMQEHALSCEALGDFATLLPRLEAELAGAKSFGACIGLVGAWSRKPGAAPGRP
jgi:SAM-dependent methyltransferase